MKKIVRAIFAITLFLTAILYVNIVFAANAEVELNAESDESGEYMTVSAKINSNPGIACFKFYLYYDSNKFTPIEDEVTFYDGEYKNNGAVNLSKKGKIIFAWLDIKNVAATGDIFSAKFKINGDYTGCKFTLRYKEGDVATEDFTNVDVTVKDVSFIENGEAEQEEPIDAEEEVETPEEPIESETPAEIPAETPPPAPTVNPLDINIINPFSDVSKSDWFYDYLMYTYANELFKGTSATTFEPNEQMTRGMFVTVLYRMVGNGEQSQSSSFQDVDINEWYGQAVSWASRKGLVSGTDTGIFSPDEIITREDMTVIIYKYFSGKPVNYNLTFSDAALISPWAKDAVRYCVSKGIISGHDDNTLAPTDGLIRAEASKMFYIVATTLNAAPATAPN